MISLGAYGAGPLVYEVIVVLANIFRTIYSCICIKRGRPKSSLKSGTMHQSRLLHCRCECASIMTTYNVTSLANASVFRPSLGLKILSCSKPTTFRQFIFISRLWQVWAAWTVYSAVTSQTQIVEPRG